MSRVFFNSSFFLASSNGCIKLYILLKGSVLNTDLNNFVHILKDWIWCCLYLLDFWLFLLSRFLHLILYWYSKYNLFSSSLLQGKSSHKFIDMSENPIMRVYYTSRPVLFFMCFFNEAFYASLYLLHFSEGPKSK